LSQAGSDRFWRGFVALTRIRFPGMIVRRSPAHSL
jgi:hypothetical protein